MIIDAHARIGRSRDASLAPDSLLAAMDELGIDVTLVAPSERCIAIDNREGNELTAHLAAESNGRVLAYAVANPWGGARAVEELRRAKDAGAVALAVDSVLQGFDLLDGLLEPLLRFAATSNWPVYVRTGTPPSALPLPLASLARRYPNLPFIMGRSGATDFWIDAAPAMRYAPNLYADTSYAPWDTVLTELGADPDIGPARVVFSTDSPYTVSATELERVRDWPLPAAARASVLGGTLSALLHIGTPSSPPEKDPPGDL